jgi:hypothetical protein
MRDEIIVETCERGMRENEIFYNLKMHRECTMFSYVLGNTVDAL